MIDNLTSLLATVQEVYGDGELPRPLALLRAASELHGGADIAEVARRLRTTRRRLEELATATDPTSQVLGCTLPVEQEKVAPRQRDLGQLLLGQIAERCFEDVYRTRVGTSELRLQDLREARNDTDYRVYNGHGRPVFRINIKFHGTTFANATTMVGLESEDCFALATYKIWQALGKQEQEGLPYIFVVVSVPGLTAMEAGAAIPATYAELSTTVHEATKSFPGKRAVEEAIVSRVLADNSPAVRAMIARIEQAPWRIISARKADNLLRELLFERVYAVRVRAFSRNYRNAEVDMHFSLSEDLTSIDAFLQSLRDRGLPFVTAALERGTM